MSEADDQKKQPVRIVQGIYSSRREVSSLSLMQQEQAASFIGYFSRKKGRLYPLFLSAITVR